MDTRSIGVLIIKITGLVMIVLSVIQIPGYFPLTSRGYNFSFGEILGTAAIALGPLALIGLLFWFFPGTVTNRIVSGPPTSDSPIDSRPLELVALTVLGVYLIAEGLIGVARATVLVVFVSRQNPGSELIPASIIANFGATAAQLLIGAIVCVGAKGISNGIEKLRQ